MIDSKLLYGFGALLALIFALAVYRKEGNDKIFWALIAIYFAIRAS